MTSAELIPIPKLSDLPEGERTATVKLLLEICHRQQAQLLAQAVQLEAQAEQLALQDEQIRQLKDEIAVLKGEKARPKIKPSTLNKDKKGRGGQGKERGKPKRKKTAELEIHDHQVIEPDEVPPGAVFKGYESYVVQELEFRVKNIEYLRARYQTLAGETVVGVLPASVSGYHFGPTLRSYILSQSYQQHVPQKLILKQLHEWGVQISSGQLNRLLIDGHDSFHAEKAEVLRAGLDVSSYVNVDDTGARHQGKNGYCTHMGNPWFAWFSSTESKSGMPPSRINFLEVLQGGERGYVVDDVAREYMQAQKLPHRQQALLSADYRCTDSATWAAYLNALGIVNARHIRIATEGALAGYLIDQGINARLVILSDDAGQFNVSGFLHGLCWVHAERTIHKLIAGTEVHRQAQEAVREQIWTFYQQLKAYQKAPRKKQRKVLEARFDEIFQQKTAFHMLNLALKRLYANKAELLLVLRRPEIPLHNNLSENDIRDYVKRRKISATTRSDTGRRARDTFLSLKKTCQKLGISFWQYLQDRLSQQNAIAPLPELIRTAAQSP